MDLKEAAHIIERNAINNSDKTPTLGTLLEEIAELARALEGKHEHPPELELIQIGGIVTNMLRQYTIDQAWAAVADRYGHWEIISPYLGDAVGCTLDLADARGSNSGATFRRTDRATCPICNH